MGMALLIVLVMVFSRRFGNKGIIDYCCKGTDGNAILVMALKCHFGNGFDGNRIGGYGVLVVASLIISGEEMAIPFLVMAF